VAERKRARAEAKATKLAAQLADKAAKEAARAKRAESKRVVPPRFPQPQLPRGLPSIPSQKPSPLTLQEFVRSIYGSGPYTRDQQQEIGRAHEAVIAMGLTQGTVEYFATLLMLVGESDGRTFNAAEQNEARVNGAASGGG
jgi:hypothetical protein